MYMKSFVRETILSHLYPCILHANISCTDVVILESIKTLFEHYFDCTGGDDNTMGGRGCV